MKKKVTRRCLHHSFITSSLHLCSALKFCLFFVNALGKEKHLTSICLHEIHCGLERNKDVGMGLWYLGVGIFLFPFFLMP